jgi:CubicO group peptidase (beta-lactamase class C family)
VFSHLKKLFSSDPKVKSPEGLQGWERADALFHNLTVEGQIPGMAITILKNGKPMLQKGYGYARMEEKIPVDPKDTLFRIASISKCITGLALGKMAEEGILNLDDSFYSHVPYFPKKKYDFTLRQLASHTAGIRGYRGKEYALNQPFGIKESISVFQDDPLVFEPGREYLYNSFDFVLLSLAMQEACGMPFEDYVEQKVLHPLGMMHTFPPKKDGLGTSAQWYTKTALCFKKSVPVDNFYKIAGGGYLSTSEDVARLGQAILDQKLLQKETYDVLLTAQEVNGKSIYYGLGFQVSQDAQGRHFVGHVGSSVGAYTNFFVYPDEKVAVSMLINCTDPKVQQTLDAAITAILDLRSL